MAAVTAAMVKELREMTGAGMMDCKKALAATEGDMDKAVEFLREKGLAGAAKKAGRIAAEGIVVTALSADEKSAVVVEVNAETDFVAKNEKFQTYAADVAAQALNTSAADMDAFMEEKWEKKEIKPEQHATYGTWYYEVTSATPWNYAMPGNILNAAWAKEHITVTTKD